MTRATPLAPPSQMAPGRTISCFGRHTCHTINSPVCCCNLPLVLQGLQRATCGAAKCRGMAPQMPACASPEAWSTHPPAIRLSRHASTPPSSLPVWCTTSRLVVHRPCTSSPCRQPTDAQAHTPTVQAPQQNHRSNLNQGRLPPD